MRTAVAAGRLRVRVHRELRLVRDLLRRLPLVLTISPVRALGASCLGERAPSRSRRYGADGRDRRGRRVRHHEMAMVVAVGVSVAEREIVLRVRLPELPHVLGVPVDRHLVPVVDEERGWPLHDAVRVLKKPALVAMLTGMPVVSLIIQAMWSSRYCRMTLKSSDQRQWLAAFVMAETFPLASR